MKVECISQAICSCTCVWELEREKHLRITQCGFYTRTTSTFHMECPFTKLILKPVSALPSPRIPDDQVWWKKHVMVEKVNRVVI